MKGDEEDDESTLADHFAKAASSAAATGGDTDANDDAKADGGVEAVRLVRDRETQQCKGFAYVLFRTADSVPYALKMNGTTYMKREIRVMVCGKKFKGRGGEAKRIPTAVDAGTDGTRKFEGKRATPIDGAMRRVRNKPSSGRPLGPWDAYRY